MSSIRVLIAEGRRMVAEAFGSLVEREPDLSVVGCLCDAQATVSRVLQDPPDVLVVEQRLAQANGIELTALVHRRAPSVRVLMLATEFAAQHVVRALEVGALGCVPKDAPSADLMQAIRVVHGGHRYVHASLAEGALRSLMRPSRSRDRLSCLSARELQVLQMMVEGHRSVAIAGALFISPKTVSTYRCRVMEKLELPDLPAVIRFALQHGIGPLPEMRAH
jgi:DNA-binding NarL/FixJ family response regulator